MPVRQFKQTPDDIPQREDEPLVEGYTVVQEAHEEADPLDEVRSEATTVAAGRAETLAAQVRLVDAVRRARAEGMTLREIAEAAGVTHETVRSWTRGEAAVSAASEIDRSEDV